MEIESTDNISLGLEEESLVDITLSTLYIYRYYNFVLFY